MQAKKYRFIIISGLLSVLISPYGVAAEKVAEKTTTTTTETKKVTANAIKTSTQTTETTVQTKKHTVDVLGVNVPYPKNVLDYHPVVSLGLGAAFLSHASQSQFFPIINPATDLSYNYDFNDRSKAAELFEAFFGFETPYDNSWMWQLGLAFSQAGNFHPKGTLTQATAISSSQYTYTYNIISRQLLLQGKILFPIRNCFYPYFLLGLGGAFNTASDFQTNVPAGVFTRQYDDRDVSSLSYQVGLGIDTEIVPNIRFGLGYRFADLGRVELGAANVNSTPVDGRLSSNNVYLHKVLAEITWAI